MHPLSLGVSTGDVATTCRIMAEAASSDRQHTLEKGSSCKRLGEMSLIVPQLNYHMIKYNVVTCTLLEA